MVTLAVGAIVLSACMFEQFLASLEFMLHSEFGCGGGSGGGDSVVVCEFEQIWAAS